MSPSLSSHREIQSNALHTLYHFTIKSVPLGFQLTSMPLHTFQTTAAKIASDLKMLEF